MQKEKSKSPKSTSSPPVPRKNDVKMVIVVNNSLDMGKGKIASQSCHSAVSLVRHLIESNQRDLLKKWAENLEAKIVVKCDSKIELLTLFKSARECNLQSYYTTDAGRTQIEPGSITTLAILGISEEIDKLTGKLKLL